MYFQGFSLSLVLKRSATSKCLTSLRIMQQSLLDFSRERRRPPSLEALAKQQAAKQKQEKDDWARVGLRWPAVLPKRLGAGRLTHIWKWHAAVAKAIRNGNLLNCVTSMAGRSAAPAADDIDPVDEAEGLEHFEVDEALLADVSEDGVLPDEVEAPTEVAAPERWRWSALTFQERIACFRVLLGRG